MHKLRGLKIFISFFATIMLLLSLLIPYVNKDSYYAATVVVAPTSTKKNKTVGHKIEGAEYYDEMWDKFRVIAVDNGGGSGEGGGAGDSNASNAGNSGSYNDAGGTFGQAAGVGLGAGNNQNTAGEGAGTNGGSTGSATADALRKLKAQIEESRAESLAKVLETAINASSVAASIAERESIQESIQKRLQQESIKAKIAQAENQNMNISPSYVAEATNTYNLDVQTISPTRSNSHNFINLDSDLKPTSEQVYYDIQNPQKTMESKISEFEPGDFVTETTNKSETTYKEDESIDRPTSESLEETLKETLQSFDQPIIYEETSTIVEEETSSIDETNETGQKETEDISDEEEGKGSKGGQDAEALEDMTGDEGQNESQGNADNKGQFQLETKGEYAGKKIFELKQNGNFGFNPEHLSVTNLNSFMSGVIFLLLMLGALIFVFNTKDKSNSNYF